MGPNKILVIDDEEVIRKALAKFFTSNGVEVRTERTGEEGLVQLQEFAPDVIVVDLKLPGMSGVEFLRKAKVMQPYAEIILITGHGTIPSAVEAIRDGAYYYVTKPFDLEDLSLLVDKAIDHKNLREENQTLKQELKSRSRRDKIVGNSKKIQDVMKLVEQVAKTDSTVLVLGESGTGKELVAKAIHYHSERSAKPLMIVNCGAIPENLLESELFGHMKGSFTGAVSNRPGRFEAANGGTIFLDEIGDMSPNLQVKILRVLQDRRFQPIGSTKTMEVDVRIIAATHQDLQVAVKEGRFREDLYYRLNVIPILLPPLRERREDIPLLLQHFLTKANKANSGRAGPNRASPTRASRNPASQKKVGGFTPQALHCLTQYSWPGNIRELENLLERLVVLKGTGPIGIEDLPENILGKNANKVFDGMSLPEQGASLKDLMGDFERAMIVQALQKSGGNRNKAALLLQLNRTTLIEKIRKCHLEKETVDETRTRQA